MSEVPADSPMRQRPRRIGVAADTLPGAALLGTPEVPTLLGYTRRVLHLHDGCTLAVFSYSNAAKANWLFLIDSRDLSVERYEIPHNDIASHGGALGADGRIYIMPYGNGRAYRFDVETKEFAALETSLPKTEYSWGAFGASNRCIYFGTYPNAYLGEYDLQTGICNLWKQAAPGCKYTHSFSEDDRGRIRFRGMGPGDIGMLFDPQTRELRAAQPVLPVSSVSLPAAPAGDEHFAHQVEVGGRRFALGFPSSRLWEVGAAGELLLRGDAQRPAEPWFLESIDGCAVGISHFGALFRYRPEADTFESGQMPNCAAGGNSIMFIEAINSRQVVGANYSQQNLFTIDPESGEIRQSSGMVARVTGEPMCAVGHAGKAYLGIYVQSLISIYDPARPFAYGANPRELSELGKAYKQTRPRAAVTDGQRVYISSDSGYNYLGGALAVIDPDTEEIDVYHHLIPDQNLPTLAYDPRNRLLWGGTDRWGQMRSHPPTQDSALIYAFDPTIWAVVATLELWPGADTTNFLGVSAAGVVIAQQGDEIALIDGATRQVLYQGKLPIGMPRKVVQGSDGNYYCLADGTFYRWDIPANSLTPVASAPGCLFLTEPSPATWLLADQRSIYRLQLGPGEHSS